MRHYLRFVAVTLCALGLSGCVERRYVVYTDPPGAMVFRNGQPLGATPADDHFVYYGKYKFTIIADGYETLTVEQDIPAPWYEYFPIDFFSENVLPWPIKDRRVFQYHLEPRRVVNPRQLLEEAQNMRNRGHSLGVPGVPEPIPPAPPAVTGQPAPGNLPVPSGGQVIPRP
ncbi:MAG: PEGA domain-containing protein [Planctomycetota bacterium]|nr:MAG: PEGA domain-containing protein [Planctomycetota bacterium]